MNENENEKSTQSMTGRTQNFDARTRQAPAWKGAYRTAPSTLQRQREELAAACARNRANGYPTIDLSRRVAKER